MVLCSSCCGKEEEPETCSKTCPKNEIVKESKPTEIEYKPVIPPILDRPVPYTFRVPTTISNYRYAGSRYAKCPPFYLQLDHVLAVVWCVFSPKPRDKKCLGISQLQWALYFLRGVRNTAGKHPPDVAIAIRAVEESLLACRSEMSELLLRAPTQPGPCMDCDQKIIRQKSVCGICTNASLAYLPRKPANYKQKTAELSASRRSQMNDNRSLMQSTTSSIMSPRFTSTKVGESKMSSGSRRNHDMCSTSKSESCEELQNKIYELKALIRQLSTDDVCEKDESNLAMERMLQKWQKHEICKIQEEMNKLHSVEKLLKQDSDKFTCTI